MREALYPRHDVALLVLAVLLLSLWARVDAQVQFSSDSGVSVYNSAVPESIVVMQDERAFQLTVSTSFVDITIEPQVQQGGNLTIVLNSCDATGSAPAIRFNSTVQLYSITVALNCTWPGARGIDALLIIKESTPLVVTIQVLSSGKVTLGTTSTSSLVTILDNKVSWSATLSGLRPLLYHVDVIGGTVTVSNSGGWGPFVLSDAPTVTRVSSGEMRLSLSSLAKITLSSSSSYPAGIFGLSQSITVTPSINVSVSGSTVTLDRCAFVVFGATVAIPSFAMNVTSSTVSFSSTSSVLTADLQNASGRNAPYSFTGAVSVSAVLSFLTFSNAYIFDIVSSFSSVASFQFASCTVTVSSSSLVSRSTFSAPTYEGLSFVFDNTTLSMNARSNLLLSSTTTVGTLSLDVRNGGTITASEAVMISIGGISSNASISINTKGCVELLTSAAMFKVGDVASAVLLSMTSGGSMTVSGSSNFLIGDMKTWNGTLDGTANILVNKLSTFLSVSTVGNVYDSLTNSKVTLDTSSTWVAASTSISLVSTTIARSSHVELLSQSQWVKSSLIGSNAPWLEVSGSGSLLVSDRSTWWSGTTVSMWSVSVQSASQVTLQKGSQLLEFIGGTATSGSGCAMTVDGVSTSVSVVDQSSLWSTGTALFFSIESLGGTGRVAVLHSSTLLSVTSAPLSSVRVSIVSIAVEFTPSSSVGWLLQGSSQSTTSLVVSLIGTSFVCRESPHWDVCRQRWMSGVSTLSTAVNVTSSTLRWGTRQRAIPTQMPFAIAGTTNNRVDLNDGKLGGSESKSQTQTSSPSDSVDFTSSQSASQSSSGSSHSLSATTVTSSFFETWTLSRQVSVSMSRTFSLSVMSKSGSKAFSESSSLTLSLSSKVTLSSLSLSATSITRAAHLTSTRRERVTVSASQSSETVSVARSDTRSWSQSYLLSLSQHSPSASISSLHSSRSDSNSIAINSATPGKRQTIATPSSRGPSSSAATQSNSITLSSPDATRSHTHSLSLFSSTAMNFASLQRALSLSRSRLFSVTPRTVTSVVTPSLGSPVSLWSATNSRSLSQISTTEPLSLTALGKSRTTTATSTCSNASKSRGSLAITGTPRKRPTVTAAITPSRGSSSASPTVSLGSASASTVSVSQRSRSAALSASLGPVHSATVADASASSAVTTTRTVLPLAPAAISRLETATVQTTQTIGSTSAAVSSVTGGDAASANVMVLLSTLSCATSGQSLDTLAISAAALSMFGRYGFLAMSLGNVGLIAVLVVVHWVCTIVLHATGAAGEDNRRRDPYDTAEGLDGRTSLLHTRAAKTLRFPSLSLNAIDLLLPPALFGGAAAVATSLGSGATLAVWDLAGGLVSCVCVVLAACVKSVLLERCVLRERRRVDAGDPVVCAGGGAVSAGATVWLSDVHVIAPDVFAAAAAVSRLPACDRALYPAVLWRPLRLRQTFGSLFLKFKSRGFARCVGPLELVVPLVTSVLSVVATTGHAACVVSSCLLTLVYLGAAVGGAVARPMRLPVNNVAIVVQFGVFCVTCVLKALSVADDIPDRLQLLQSGILIVKVVLGLLLAYREGEWNAVLEPEVSASPTAVGHLHDECYSSTSSSVSFCHSPSRCGDDNQAASVESCEMTALDRMLMVDEVVLSAEVEFTLRHNRRTETNDFLLSSDGNAASCGEQSCSLRVGSPATDCSSSDTSRCGDDDLADDLLGVRKSLHPPATFVEHLLSDDARRAVVRALTSDAERLAISAVKARTDDGDGRNSLILSTNGRDTAAESGIAMSISGQRTVALNDLLEVYRSTENEIVES